MNTRRQSLFKEAEIFRPCLHEVVKTTSVDLGPHSLFQINSEKQRKLAMRLIGIDSDFNPIRGRTEYGHIVEVTSLDIHDSPFDVITGPFKNVNVQLLIDQVELTPPEEKVVISYKSGRSEWLKTLSRMFTEQDSQCNNTKTINSQNEDFQERAKRYTKKKQKKATHSRQQSIAADDDIATLIASTGKSALSTDDTTNTAKSVNQMVTKWQEQEAEQKIVEYDSDNDSPEYVEEDGCQIRVFDSVLQEKDTNISGWERLKSACCCYSHNELERLRRLSMVPVTEDVHNFRDLRDDRASERLWLPQTENIVKMQRTLKALQTSNVT